MNYLYIEYYSINHKKVIDFSYFILHFYLDFSIALFKKSNIR